MDTKSEIEKTDRKIDEEVCKLYGLTDGEIKFCLVLVACQQAVPSDYLGGVLRRGIRENFVAE